MPDSARSGGPRGRTQSSQRGDSAVAAGSPAELLRDPLVQFIDGLCRDQHDQELSAPGHDEELVTALSQLQARLRTRAEAEAMTRRVADAHASRLHALADRLALANAALEEAEVGRREATEFAYVASHDLKQPLCAIQSFSELLQEEYADQLDEQAAQWLGFIVDGSRRAAHLVQDLLEFARLGHHASEFRTVDMRVVAEAAQNNLRSSIDETGAEIVCDELPAVRGDATQLTQLLQNLVSNALKFAGGKPPRVRIDATNSFEGACFTVSDRGIGIPSDQRERVFGLFTRLHDREQYPGSGLGLAICQRIVDRHGGKIWVESEPGSGTRVSFTLPLE